jgi:hypothetical protein
MPVDDLAADGHDPILVHALYLAQANAALTVAHAEHEAVLKRLGTRAPPPTRITREVARPTPGVGAYRGKDELVELQRAIDEAQLATRTLRGQTSALESECDMQFAPGPFGASAPGRAVITLMVLAGIGGLVWLLIDFGGESAIGLISVGAFLAFIYAKLFAPKKSTEE